MGLFTGKKNKSSKTVQSTIPFVGVYKNGIIEVQEGYYTKSYFLEDIDFKTVADDISETIFDTFGDLLNSFDSTMSVQFTIDNKKINKRDFERQILARLRGDSLDELRDEYNQILKNKLKESRSNVQHKKYMTVCLKATSIDDAIVIFSRLDSTITRTIKKISGGETKPMTLLQRLEIIYNMLNRNDNNDKFYEKIKINNNRESESFNYSWLKKQGLSVKDVLAPPSIEFFNTYMKLGDKFARSLYLASIPHNLSTDMIADVTDLPLDTVTTISYQPIEPAEAIALVRKELTKAKRDVMEAQKNAAKGGYSEELIPESTKEGYEEADLMLEEVTKGNQKLFLTSVITTIYSDTKEELDLNTKSVQQIASGQHICKFKPMFLLQEIGLKDTIPVCNMEFGCKSLLTTKSACVFLPYTTKELSQSGGIYYGLNAVSKNMIIWNRKTAVNGNGIILGMTGTGKSFSAKREIYHNALSQNDVILIIDPQGEYKLVVNDLNGAVIPLEIGSNKYLNPLDMDLNYAGEADPITLKSDYICSLCEIALRGEYGLTPTQISIINRCVRLVYRDYMTYIIVKKNEGITIDRDKMPTLQDLYEELMHQDDEEARYIATALELYTSGSFDTFAHRTNIRTNARIISYDISAMGENMWELGINVCLNDVWNRMLENHKKGIRTWIYIDEFHLLTNYDSSIELVKKFYKMARKYGGIPTGITQNIGDFLYNPKARTILNNCSFVYMLSQSPNDRDELADIYSISDNQLPYITNGGHGQGLIYNGKSIVPFIDEFPEDTKMYRQMTTKPEDFVANL